MNELATKWLEALRSGKYQQGQGELRRASKFCCLGVLCDVYDPTRWGPGQIYTPNHDSMPPDEIILAVGLSPSAAGGLAQLNDEGATFEHIAREIERILK